VSCGSRWITCRRSSDPRRWIPGDLHMHVSPFDDREGTTLDAAAGFVYANLDR
jgi:hypothetical protein